MFSVFKRKPLVPPRPPTFPDRNMEVAWMTETVAWARAHHAEVAVGLFDPTSGDYLLNAIATGTHLTPDIRKAYRHLRDQNADLADASKDLPMCYSVSSIAECLDIDAHRHRIHPSLL